MKKKELPKAFIEHICSFVTVLIVLTLQNHLIIAHFANFVNDHYTITPQNVDNHETFRGVYRIKTWTVWKRSAACIETKRRVYRNVSWTDRTLLPYT